MDSVIYEVIRTLQDIFVEDFVNFIRIYTNKVAVI
jgi:hypothetical protein